MTVDEEQVSEETTGEAPMIKPQLSVITKEEKKTKAKTKKRATLKQKIHQMHNMELASELVYEDDTKKYRSPGGIKDPRLAIRPSTTSSPGSREGLRERKHRIRKELRRGKSRRSKSRYGKRPHVKRHKHIVKEEPEKVFDNYTVVLLHDLQDKTNPTVDYLSGICPQIMKATKKRFTVILYHQYKFGHAKSPVKSPRKDAIATGETTNTEGDHARPSHELMTEEELMETPAYEHLCVLKDKIENRMALQHTLFRVEIHVASGDFFEGLRATEANMIVARVGTHKGLGKIPNQLFKTPLPSSLLLVPAGGYRPRVANVSFVTNYSERELYKVRNLDSYTKLAQAWHTETLFLSVRQPKPAPLEKTSSLSKLLKLGGDLVHTLTHPAPHSLVGHGAGGTTEVESPMVMTHGYHHTPEKQEVSKHSSSKEPFTSPLTTIDTRIEFKQRDNYNAQSVHRFVQTHHTDLVAVTRTAHTSKFWQGNNTPIGDMLILGKFSSYYYLYTKYPVLVLPDTM